MGLLSRLRAWLGDLFGGPDGDDPGGEPRSADEGPADGDDRDGGADDRLDPSAATETRTGATDDAVDALRDVRRKGSAPSVDDPESADAEAGNSESGGGGAETTDPEN